MAIDEDKPCDNNEIPNNPSNEQLKRNELSLQRNNPKQPNTNRTNIKQTKSSSKNIFDNNRKITQPQTTTTSSAGSKKEQLSKNQTSSPVSPSNTSSGGAGSPGGSGTSGPAPQLGNSNGAPAPENKTNDKDCDKTVSVYPFNKVLQTESGHVMEMDDNPGNERIHISHRSGSNIEFLPAGSVSAMITRDMWLSVYRDAHMHIDGYANITVDKAVRIVVNKDELNNKEEEAVNLDVYVGGKANVNLYVKGGNVNITLDNGDVNMRMKDGDLNIRQDKGNYNHFVNGDYNLEVTGNMHTVVGANSLTEVGKKKETIVNGDEILTLTGQNSQIYRNCYSYNLNSSHKFEQLLGNMTVSVGNNHNMSIFGEKNLEVYGVMNTSSLENNIFTKIDYRLTIGGIGNFYTHKWNRRSERLERPEDDPCPIALQTGVFDLQLVRGDILSLERSQPQTCPKREILDLPNIDIFDIQYKKDIKEKEKYLKNIDWYDVKKITISTVVSPGIANGMTATWHETLSRKRDN